MGSIEGFLEDITETNIRGWVYDKRTPDTPVEIVIFSDDTEVGRALADTYRVDLHAAGIGNGRHAFTLNVDGYLDRSRLKTFVGGNEVFLKMAWGEVTNPAEYLLNFHPSKYLFDPSHAKRLLADCLREHTGLSPFRLIGLMDAFCRLPAGVISNILSVGCGEGLHEKYLSLCHRQANILAIDIAVRTSPEAYKNIAFRDANILEWDGDYEKFDFAFSIECLEHIPQYEAAFAAMARKVKRGGYIYISVPFANEDERKDSALCLEELQLHEHVTPGFSVELVKKMCADNDAEICFIEGMFFRDAILPFKRVFDSLDVSVRDELVNDLYMLASIDLKGKVAKSRNEALGIRFLARRN